MPTDAPLKSLAKALVPLLVQGWALLNAWRGRKTRYWFRSRDLRSAHSPSARGETSVSFTTRHAAASPNMRSYELRQIGRPGRTHECMPLALPGRALNSLLTRSPIVDSSTNSNRGRKLFASSGIGRYAVARTSAHGNCIDLRHQRSAKYLNGSTHERAGLDAHVHAHPKQQAVACVSQGRY